PPLDQGRRHAWPAFETRAEWPTSRTRSSASFVTVGGMPEAGGFLLWKTPHRGMTRAHSTRRSSRMTPTNRAFTVAQEDLSELRRARTPLAKQLGERNSLRFRPRTPDRT